MEEPSPRSSRLALAGGVAAAIVLGGGGFLLGRGTTERAPVVAAPMPVVATTPVVTSKAPAAPVIIGRADLIALAAAATEAAAAGNPLPASIAAAAGRRFDIRLPFGCDGPAPEDGTAMMRWRYDAVEGALRVHVAPVVWSAAEWWRGEAPTGVERVEGFWIRRPWTMSETCSTAPAVATGSEAITLPGQVLALGQTQFGDERREGEAYDAVVRVAADAVDPAQGLHLRLSGRIATTENGGAVLCRQPAGPEQRPICLIRVAFDAVAVENPANGDAIATWDVARRER